eukprot:CFRG0260T1
MAVRHISISKYHHNTLHTPVLFVLSSFTVDFTFECILSAFASSISSRPVPVFTMTSPIDGLLLAAEILERGDIGDNRAKFERSRYSISSIDSEYDISLRGSVSSSYKSLTGYKRTVKSRETHNLLEKNRRAQLKSCFSSLQSVLPCTKEQKLSTVAILEQAAEHIVVLRQHHYDILKNLETQRQQRQQLMSTLQKRGIHVKLPEDRPLGPRPTGNRSYSVSDTFDSMEGVENRRERRRHRFSISEDPEMAEMDEDCYSDSNYDQTSNNNSNNTDSHYSSPIPIPSTHAVEDSNYRPVSSSATTPSISGMSFGHRGWGSIDTPPPIAEETNVIELEIGTNHSRPMQPSTANYDDLVAV